MKKGSFLLPIILIGFCLSCDKILSPVVKTVSCEVVTLESVLLTGEVINESGGAVTKRGFYWGTSQNPTLADSSSDNGYGPGVFTESVSNLIYGQEYFFRSYAIDSKGTQFGKTLSVKVELTPATGTMTDSRDGKAYGTVKINNQTWLSGNLAYLPTVSPSSNGSETNPFYYVYYYEGSSVPDAKKAANYDTYGVLYNWAAAKTVCPTGWHLPSDSDWTLLTDYLGTSAGGLMKETTTTHWGNPNVKATNASGFTALPGGFCYGNGGFGDLGDFAFFWSSSESGSRAWSRVLSYNEGGVSRDDNYRNYGFAVRCVKDN